MVELVGGIVSSRDIMIEVETTENTATGELSNELTAFKIGTYLRMDLNLQILFAKLPAILICQSFFPLKIFTIRYY